MESNQSTAESQGFLKEAPLAVNPSSPEVDRMVRDLLGKVADKWTMLVLDALEEHGRMRFTQLGACVGGVSQKMLTKTLRQMESDGLVQRTVHPVIPPHVEYEVTELGVSLADAFCPLWQWVQAHITEVDEARRAFWRAQQATVGDTQAE